MRASVFQPSLFLVLAFAAMLPAQGGRKGGGTTPPPADATLAFVKESRLTLARADGTGQTGIGSRTVNATGGIAWAPAGGAIYFQGDNPRGTYKIRPDGTGEELVVLHAQAVYGLAVTRDRPCPDGALRLFYVEGIDLWTIRLDGTGRIQLTSGRSLAHPSVAPTGDRVIAVDNYNDLALLTLDVIGGQLAVIESRSLVWENPQHPLHGQGFRWPWFEDFAAATNPAGDTVTFLATPAVLAPHTLCRLDVTSPAAVSALPTLSGALHVSLSPDGQHVYYNATNAQGESSIHRALRDGSGVTDCGLAARRRPQTKPCTRPQ